ncbi:hypothetical protein SAMN04488137_1017 [Fictibacillus solisalsi]|uniref:Uncharacterized protein n=1 Tax=Fictibacillus solisalsi TaxID=459525 RepID=A0A1G9UMG3_9BACL|nr:hypothetical protein [Fictibacillus solisalsi]SDM61130.1 hypothetical protein SAMN04488137_1017 [Fictibacillus solisalsi]
MRRNELKGELELKVKEMEVEANRDRHSPETKKVWRELGKRTEACFALNQKDGVYSACLRPVAKGKTRCTLHGANVNDNVSEETKLKKMQNLRPDAGMIHGLYAEESTFVQSLTDAEIEFMAWLDDSVRQSYEVEQGLGDLVLEGLLHDAVIHFRLLNSGRFEKGSRHTAKPLQDLMKACKDMGWTKKEQNNQSQSSQVLDRWLKRLDSDSNEEKPLN